MQIQTCWSIQNRLKKKAINMHLIRFVSFIFDWLVTSDAICQAKYGAFLFKSLTETVNFLSLSFHKPICATNLLTIKYDVQHIILQHSKEYMHFTENVFICHNEKHINAFVSHQSYPLTTISVTLSQPSGFSLTLHST